MKYAMLYKKSKSNFCVTSFNTADELNEAQKSKKFICSINIGTEYCDCVQNVRSIFNRYMELLGSSVRMVSSDILYDVDDCTDAKYAYVYFAIDDPVAGTINVNVKAQMFGVFEYFLEKIGIKFRESAYEKEYMIIFEGGY